MQVTNLTEQEWFHRCIGAPLAGAPWERVEVRANGRLFRAGTRPSLFTNPVNLCYTIVPETAVCLYMFTFPPGCAGSAPARAWILPAFPSGAQAHG